MLSPVKCIALGCFGYINAARREISCLTWVSVTKLFLGGNHSIFIPMFYCIYLLTKEILHYYFVAYQMEITLSFCESIKLTNFHLKLTQEISGSGVLFVCLQCGVFHSAGCFPQLPSHRRNYSTVQPY